MTDAERLWRRLHEVAEIGKAEGGGVTRLSFTDEERAAKDLVASYMEEAGLEVREDAAGNLIGRREGSEADAPVMLTGSHVDSVPNGGNFDGPLGVLAAVEALQVMREQDTVTRRPVEVVAFTDEEGARFSFGMVGSRALAAAAAVMRLIEEEATATGSTVGTVGQLDLSPGGINIIPGRVSLSLDLRDIDEAVRDGVEGRILDGAREICAARGVGFGVETLQRLAPAPCSGEARAAARAACEEFGIEPFELPSGAGHDGMQLAGLCPIGMIFVRSKDGISHNPAEWSSKEDCATGAEVLRRTLIALANR